jgi:hypothetical protein
MNYFATLIKYLGRKYTVNLLKESCETFQIKLHLNIEKIKVLSGIKMIAI